MWNAQTGEGLARFYTGSRPVWSVAWSPDGGYLAAGDGVYDNHSVNGQIFILETPAFP
jgi:WD40 repeat protein